MNKKNWIRAIVLLGMLTWPGVETLRYLEAKQELAQSIERQRAVSERLAYLKQIQVPAPAEETPVTAPVVNPKRP